MLRGLSLGCVVALCSRSASAADPEVAPLAPPSAGGARRLTAAQVDVDEKRRRKKAESAARKKASAAAGLLEGVVEVVHDAATATNNSSKGGKKAWKKKAKHGATAGYAMSHHVSKAPSTPRHGKSAKAAARTKSAKAAGGKSGKGGKSKGGKSYVPSRSPTAEPAPSLPTTASPTVTSSPSSPTQSPTGSPSESDYPAYNMHSVVSYKLGIDGTETSLVGKDKLLPGKGVSWTSLVECYPDVRKVNGNTLDNYMNFGCDGAFDDAWRSTSTQLFPCGNQATPVYYVLEDMGGTKDTYITCHIEGSADDNSLRRVLTFPSGYFLFDNQVWLAPLTKVVGAGNPTIESEDIVPRHAPGDQTLFFALKGGEADGKTYDSFDPHAKSSYFESFDDISQQGYCKPQPGFKPGAWGNEAENSLNPKQMRVGFLLHGFSDLENLNILGNDLVRPTENGALCGGGAIETPGCVGYFGPNEYQAAPLACYDKDDMSQSDQNLNQGLDESNGPYFWMTGGVKDWAKEYENFGGIGHIAVKNVRLNDPYYRYFDENALEPNGEANKNPLDWPASQLAFYIAATPDGSYIHDVEVDGLVSITTIADGLNVHGSAEAITVRNSFMGNSGDDTWAIWQGMNDIKDVSFTNIKAYNPGIRQGTQYGSNQWYSWASCFGIFGCHSANITGFTCYDRRCPSSAELNPSGVESKTMCIDPGNGHMMTFYPNKYFGGKYQFDDGYCHVVVDDWNWLYMGNPSQEINQGDTLAQYEGSDWPYEHAYLHIKRDAFSRCVCGCGDVEEWAKTDAPEGPYLSVDGQNKKSVRSFESSEDCQPGPILGGTGPRTKSAKAKSPRSKSAKAGGKSTKASNGEKSKAGKSSHSPNPPVAEPSPSPTSSPTGTPSPHSNPV